MPEKRGASSGTAGAGPASCAQGRTRLRACAWWVCKGDALSFLGKRERDDGSSGHKQGRGGRAGPGRGLSPAGPSVDLTTSFKCPLGGSAVDLNVGLGPGDDVARKGLGAAGGQVVHLPRGQLAVPDVEMGQLAHERLSGIKPTTQSVLQKQEEEVGGGCRGRAS